MLGEGQCTEKWTTRHTVTFSECASQSTFEAQSQGTKSVCRDWGCNILTVSFTIYTRTWLNGQIENQSGKQMSLPWCKHYCLTHSHTPNLSVCLSVCAHANLIKAAHFILKKAWFFPLADCLTRTNLNFQSILCSQLLVPSASTLAAKRHNSPARQRQLTRFNLGPSPEVLSTYCSTLYWHCRSGSSASNCQIWPIDL